jgi:6-phosphogluconolactonase
VGTQESSMQALWFDTRSGQLRMIGPVAEGIRATWSVAHPQLPILYAVDDENARQGSVTAFSVDRDSGMLSRINQVASGGNGTTYLALDQPSMSLLAVNYGSGSSVSLGIDPDGRLGPLQALVQATGSGPNRRQASAHEHGVAVDPSGRYALVADLGADRVFVYGFERATHTLRADDSSNSHAYIAPAGSGPRHLVFGADGRFVYLISELSAEISTLRWDAAQGGLTLVQSLPISSEAFAGVKSGAEIAVSRDGRFVYAEDRAENTLLVYQVNPESGALSLLQRISSGGERPWGFAIHVSEKWMLVANQRSGRINVFSIDPASGLLSDSGQSADVATPVSITFVK